jgi:hypothetical protein
MSLEDKIDALTAALTANTTALGKIVGAAKGGAAAGAPAGAAAGTTKPKTTTAPKGPTLEDIQNRFGAYMSVTDKTERAERKQHVLNIAGKFSAERATLIPPANFAEALALLTQYEAGEDPFAEEGEGEGEEASAI